MAINPSHYSHSPIHYAVVSSDHTALSRLLSTLPKLSSPSHILSESDSLQQELLSDTISSLLDRRHDIPHRETPLHLAVRLNDPLSASALASAGADVSLQNSSGWNPLQEALCRRNSDIALLLLRHHHHSAWAKWRRRLPRVIAALRRMRDFYMEISFHFESSVIPFVGKIAPSDTYRIWKRDGNLRADTSLAGFDGLKIQRADQSFLFLGDGDVAHGVPCGSLLVVNRDARRIFDAFENAGGGMSDSEAAGLCAQTSVYRPGMDVTRAELVGRTNWRRQEKTETVGEWKAKVYEVHNVVFSFRSRKVAAADADVAGSEQVLPLELDEDEDGFLVAENPLPMPPDRRRHSSFVREEREWYSSVGRKSVDLPSMAAPMRGPPRKNSNSSSSSNNSNSNNNNNNNVGVVMGHTKEKEYVRSLRPLVWLTEQFPLKTEEILPLLDILANKVKAVRRMRELLTTKFPPGTFPVKLAIPVVPTVRVVITFTKFVELQPVEQFYTPFSSPRHLLNAGKDNNEHHKSETSSNNSYISSSSSSSVATTWLRRNNGQNKQQQRSTSSVGLDSSDPFAIPAGYTWSRNSDDKSQKMMKKSKSVRKSSK